MDKNNIEKILDNAKELVKKENEIHKAKRKSAFTVNIISFIGIVTMSSAATIISNSSFFDIEKIENLLNQEKTALLMSFAVILTSFLLGLLASYRKTISKNSEIDVHNLLKSTFFDRIDKSYLNPNL